MDSQEEEKPSQVRSERIRKCTADADAVNVLLGLAQQPATEAGPTLVRPTNTAWKSNNKKPAPNNQSNISASQPYLTKKGNRRYGPVDNRCRPPKAALNVLPYGKWRQIRLPTVLSAMEAEDLVVLWAHFKFPESFNRFQAEQVMNFSYSHYASDEQELKEQLLPLEDGAQLENYLKFKYLGPEAPAIRKLLALQNGGKKKRKRRIEGKPWEDDSEGEEEDEGNNGHNNGDEEYSYDEEEQQHQAEEEEEENHDNDSSGTSPVKRGIGGRPRIHFEKYTSRDAQVRLAEQVAMQEEADQEELQGKVPAADAIALTMAMAVAVEEEEERRMRFKSKKFKSTSSSTADDGSNEKKKEESSASVPLVALGVKKPDGSNLIEQLHQLTSAPKRPPTAAPLSIPIPPVLAQADPKLAAAMAASAGPNGLPGPLAGMTAPPLSQIATTLPLPPNPAALHMVQQAAAAQQLQTLAAAAAAASVGNNNPLGFPLGFPLPGSSAPSSSGNTLKLPAVNGNLTPGYQRLLEQQYQQQLNKALQQNPPAASLRKPQFNANNAPPAGQQRKKFSLDRPGRPPSYDEMVKWCVALKRCLMQRQVAITIDESLQMVNNAEFYQQELDLGEQPKLLVASTLRKRVLGIFKMTWTNVASGLDDEKDEEVEDPTVLIAAAAKLRKLGVAPNMNLTPGGRQAAAQGDEDNSNTKPNGAAPPALKQEENEPNPAAAAVAVVKEEDSLAAAIKASFPNVQPPNQQQLPETTGRGEEEEEKTSSSMEFDNDDELLDPTSDEDEGEEETLGVVVKDQTTKNHKKPQQTQQEILQMLDPSENIKNLKDVAATTTVHDGQGMEIEVQELKPRQGLAQNHDRAANDMIASLLQAHVDADAARDTIKPATTAAELARVLKSLADRGENANRHARVGGLSILGGLADLFQPFMPQPPPESNDNNNNNSEKRGFEKFKEEVATVNLNDFDAMFSVVCGLNNVPGIEKSDCQAICRMWMENELDDQRKKHLLMYIKANIDDPEAIVDWVKSIINKK